MTRTIIKLKYLCRWCKEPFETSSEYLDNFIVANRLLQMHECNRKNHDKYPNAIPLRSGVGDLVGYTVVKVEP